MRRLSRVAVVPVVLIALLAGCGGSTSAASKTSFCADNAKLDQATASDTSLGELLTTLKANQSTLDDFGKTAPSNIKAKAQTLVTAAQTAIKSNTTAAFSPQFANAGKAVDAYCGQNAQGTATS